MYVIILLIMSAVICATPRPLRAAGTLDEAFGDAGIVTTALGSSSTAFDVVVQADDKLVAAGSSDGRFALARYHTDGTLDSTFGLDGTVTTTYPFGVGYARTLAIQPDGKLVAAGQLASHFALVRYESDGSRDPTFGNDGFVLGPVQGYIRALLILGDGKIIAVGTDGGDFVLTRYHADGRVDRAFGHEGLGITDTGGWNLPCALLQQADRKLIVAGNSSGDLALARYHLDGTLDSSFGSDGIVMTHASGAISCGVAQLANGRLVAAAFGDRVVGTFPRLFRFHPDGSLDTTFGALGSVATGRCGVTDLLLQRDGKLLTASFFDHDLCLERYMADGAVDLSFGMDGLVQTDVARGHDVVRALVRHGGDAVVVAGFATLHESTVFTLARYLVDVGPETTTTTATTSTTSTSTTTSLPPSCLPFLSVPDADGDGEVDFTDRCWGSTPGLAVDAAGCSLEQFCASVDISTRTGRKACRRLDWKNDEPLMKRRSRDCKVAGVGSARRCVPARQQ